MPIQFYLGRDLQGQDSEPTFHQEIAAILPICRHLWVKLNPLKEVYAVIINNQRIGVGQELAPDLVIISEMGLGVVELKDSFGLINCREPFGHWMAGKHQIMSYDRLGVDEHGRNKEFINPAMQVRFYARAIRQHLLSPKPRAWLPGENPFWGKMKLQTAICFTNLLADIRQAKRDIIARYPPGKVLEEWEVLSLLTPAEIAEWTFNLRFDVQTGHADYYRPLKLSPDEVVMLAEQFFGGKAWDKIIGYLQAGLEPFGYLCILDDNGQASFSYHLEHADTLIGRDPEACTLVIPGSHTSVSRKHARIIRTEKGVFITDTGSSHGTFLNKKQIHGLEPVPPGAIISLGPDNPGTTCRLKFTLEPPSPTLPTTTTQ